eukprot:403355451
MREVDNENFDPKTIKQKNVKIRSESGVEEDFQQNEFARILMSNQQNYTENTNYFRKSSIKYQIKQNRKKQPYCRKFGKKFKNIDILVGASVSFILLATIFAFFVYKLMIMQMKGETKLSRKSFFMDLDSDDSEEINVGQGGFDFAAGLLQELQPKYGYITMSQVKIEYDPVTQKGIKSKINLEFEKCGNKYFNFPNQDKVKLYGINKQFQIRLRKCEFTEKYNQCAPKKEIDSFFENEQFSIAMVNQYFDFNNYTQPIQKLIQDDIDKVREFSDQVVDNNTLVGTFYLRLDNQYDIYERRVYGIGDLLGDMGGFKESILIIGMLAVGFVQEKMFLASLLRHFYQVETTQNVFDNDDNSMPLPTQNNLANQTSKQAQFKNSQSY